MIPRGHTQPVAAGRGWGDDSAGQTALFDGGVSNIVQIAAGGYHSLALFRDGTLAAKGTYLTGPALAPPSLTNLVQVAAGFSHSLGVSRDGRIFAWGDNNFGQTNVPVGLTAVRKVASGAFHCLVLNSNGTVRSWGDNSRTQTRVPAGLAEVLDVAGGYYHSLALLKTRRVLGWGDNRFGQAIPPADLEDVVAIAGGAAHSLALRGDGTVVSWGSDTKVPAGLSNVVAIAAGDSFSLALQRDGLVVAWGNNSSGQTNVPVGLSNVVAIAAGAAHALALLGPAPWPVIRTNPASVLAQEQSDVTLQVLADAPGPLQYAWWFNGNPIPGATNATLTVSNVGPSVVGIYSVFVDAGGFTVQSAAASIAIERLVIIESSRDQTILAGSPARLSVTVLGAAPIAYQWYFNDGAIPNATQPVLLLSTVQSADAGRYTLVAMNSSGSVTNPPIRLNVVFSPRIAVEPTNQIVLLGENATFRVEANGTAPLRYQWRLEGTNLPGATNALLLLQRPDVDRAGAYSVVVTNAYGVATSRAAILQVRVPDGAVRAWGGDFSGETLVPIGLSNVIAITAGDSISAAVTQDGSVTVWGRNATSTLRPPPGLTNMVEVSVGFNHLLARRADGTVVAWGDAASGATNVPAGLSNVISIAAGGDVSLAVQADGSLRFWGKPFSTPVPTGLSNMTAVAASTFDAIALRRDGRVVALGNAWPPPDNLSNVIAISAAGIHYLALRDDGTVAAWPDRSDFPESQVPAGLSDVVAISAGNRHSLALRRDGTMAAWGDNRNGQAAIPPTVSSNVVAISAGVSHNLALVGVPVWPSLLTQPRSVITNEHATVRFEVLASSPSPSPSPAPLSYQWQHQGADLPGATNAALELVKVSAADVGSYRVIVSANRQRVFSRPATLTLFTPVFLEFPFSQEILELQKLVLTANVVGAPPLEFQWYAKGAPIAGATNPTLALANVQLADAGSYQLRVQNPFTNVLSPSLTLTVWQRPRIRTDTSETIFDHRTVTLPEGADLSFQAEATGTPPLQFAWRASMGGILVSNSILALTNLQFRQSGSYHLSVTSPYTDAAHASPASLDLLLQVVAPGGRVVTWGSANETSTPIPANLSNVIALAAGFRHNLALRQNGTVIGWGQNTVGQLGIAAGRSNVVAIAAAGDYSLAVLDNGLVLGAGRSSWPAPLVSPAATNVLHVSASTNHVLALRRNGTVLAWGRNTFGQLNVPAGLSNVIAVAAGGNHSLALRDNGLLVGWGNNLSGQAQPPQPPMALSNVIAIAAGYQHSLALLRSGLVQAWGDNNDWQLTGSPTSDNAALLRLGVTNIIAIAAGQDYSMALRADGRIIAWGAANRFSDGIISVPPGLLNAVLLAAGPGHGLALTGIPLAARPVLTAQRRTSGLLVSWPIASAGYVLEGTDDLTLPFVPLPYALVTNENSATILVLLPMTNAHQFLRLAFPASGNPPAPPPVP
ncbi:MAG TPA: hypothetical protein VNU68_12700 [Verrucomicrobiae bacterium]|nr:hypothetical protein [Verrucomicrobiae bacterium]